jgi:hypothetical protein
LTKVFYIKNENYDLQNSMGRNFTNCSDTFEENKS